VSTTTISGTIQDPTGAALSGVTVVARILPRPAFVTATGVELAPLYSTTTNGSGVYSLTLTCTADITPAGSFYEITEYIPDRYGGPVKHVIQVGASPATVYASLVSAPPATDTSTYLTQAAADARYVQSPGSFAAAGTIADSRPGDAAAAGVAATYARGDHVHDRETQRGTAATISALSGTDLIQGYPYVTTDANNITGTGIYTPHTTSQPARADSLWVKNAQRFQPGFWNQPWGIVGTAQATSNQTGVSAEADVTSVTVTWTAAANRRYKITVTGRILQQTSAGIAEVKITDGSSVLQDKWSFGLTASQAAYCNVIALVTPAAGSVTYKARLSTTAGTVDTTAASTQPFRILVEDIGPNGAAA